jgi:hypothetical protein
MDRQRPRIAAAASAIVLAFGGIVMAAPLGNPTPPTIGEPILQWFTGSQSSVVETADGTVCVASQPIDIIRSSYVDPAGASVPFDSVVRSHAASVQFLATRADDRQSLRVQLKYSPLPGAPMAMQIGSRRIDLAPWVEASGDSIRITDQALVTIARAALEGDMPLTVSAVSRATGRRVTDRIEGLRFSGYDACRAGPALAARPPELAPSDRVSMEFVVFPGPATQATAEEHRICRVEEPGSTLYRGQLTSITGFVSQTRAVFVTYDEGGQIDQLYVPGIVEGRRRADGTLRTLVSIAANANDPMAEAETSGCIGPAPVALCHEASGSGHRLVQCIGTLLASDPSAIAPLEDAEFLIGSLLERGGSSGPAAVSRLAAVGTGGGVGGGGFGGGGNGGGTGAANPSRSSNADPVQSRSHVTDLSFLPGNGDPTGFGPDSTGSPGNPGTSGSPQTSSQGGGTPAMPVIPLPASLLLLSSALGTMGVLSWARKRRERCI